MGTSDASEYDIWRTDVIFWCRKESSGGIIMAEPRVFLKENRGRIEENYLEQAKKPAPGFCACRRKITEMYRGSGTCM